jgi:hypothetical protein
MEQENPISKDEFSTMDKIVCTSARRYSKRSRISFNELRQEAWVHAIVARRSFLKLSADRQDNFEGWIYRQVVLRLCSFCRHAVCPVSFPKRKVPDLIREGVFTIPILGDREYAPGFLEHDFELMVDLGRILEAVERHYPLAAPIIKKESDVKKVAEASSLPIEDVQREVTHARTMIREELKTLREAR